ncbi:MAG TPA: ABC transporter permease [Vicinamibacterales bacterium]
MNGGVPAFLIRRFAGGVVFVAVVSTSALVLVRLAPGDATADLALTGADQATIAAERARLGLDRPVLWQLGAWAAGITRLDLGRSSLYNRPVAGLVFERARHTAALAALALFVATAIGLPLGVLTGARPRGVLAAIVSPLSIALVACPPLVGALGLLLLAVTTGWLSTASGSWAVPTLALALPLAATLERLQSQATAESLSAPDITAAAARGVPSGRLIWLHAARQSLRPVLGVYGIVIGTLFSGSLAVEAITGWPGLGRLMSDALVGRDLFLTAGCALAGGVLIALGNVFADVTRALLDPRIREQV